jgi:hypothetical protein
MNKFTNLSAISGASTTAPVIVAPNVLSSFPAPSNKFGPIKLPSPSNRSAA